MAKADQPNPWRYFHMGLELAIAAVTFAGLGWLIDSRFGSAPWGLLGGAAIGLVAGMYLFIRQARQALAQSMQRSRQPEDDDDLSAS